LVPRAASSGRKRSAFGGSRTKNTYEELLQRDKVSLDITWLQDESLEDTDDLPPPEVIAQEIVEDLEAALAEFAQIAVGLGTEEGPH
jgi:type I restriction enzyme M protein